MSLLGKLFKGAVGFATGGPLGAARAVLSGKARSAVLTSFAPDSIIRKSFTTPFTRSTEERIYTNGGTVDGGRAGPFGGMPQVPIIAPGATCPVGFRLNKSTYVTRGGGTSRWPVGLTVHPKGSTCVKRRRRNVGNARALRRAISRVKGFVKLARKAHSLVGGQRGKQKRLAPGQNIEIVRG